MNQISPLFSIHETFALYTRNFSVMIVGAECKVPCIFVKLVFYISEDRSKMVTSQRNQDLTLVGAIFELFKRNASNLSFYFDLFYSA